MADFKPLVLDVDGTFLRSDVLFECFWAALARRPFRALAISATNLRKPARLKRALADLADLRTDLLPTNPAIKSLAESSAAAGREVILASASDERLVRQVAADHGLSPTVFASDGVTNLKGPAKAAALVDRFGVGGFDYAGNEWADCPIWEKADNALIVGSHPDIEVELARAGKSTTSYPGDWTAGDLLRGLRPLHWSKNLLLLIPMLAEGALSLTTLWTVVAGMVIYSAAASSVYIINDLLDLESDRLHPAKHARPFASGAVPIRVGMVVSVILGVAALTAAIFLGPFFLASVALYLGLSVAYSLRLKRVPRVDIATLVALYGLRLVAGAAAAQLL